MNPISMNFMQKHFCVLPYLGDEAFRLRRQVRDDKVAYVD